MKKAALRQIQGRLEQLCRAVVSRERTAVSRDDLEEMIRRVIQEPREVAHNGAELEKAQKDLAGQIAELGERLRHLELEPAHVPSYSTPSPGTHEAAPVPFDYGSPPDLAHEPIDAMAQASGHSQQDAASILDMLHAAGWAVLKVRR